MRLLERPRKLLDAADRCADANQGVRIKFCAQRIGDRTGELFKILRLNIRAHLFNKRDIRFVDIDHEILGLIREQVLNNVVNGYVVVFQNADEQHDAGGVVVKTKLPRLEVDISRQDIVEDHVLMKLLRSYFSS